MKPIALALAAALAALAVSPALAAESCTVASSAPDGSPLNSDISLDLAAGTKLDPAALPERASGVMCLRSSLVPRAGDERVLSDWSVSFGIAEHGPRSLWIWVKAGMIQIKVDHGELDAREKAAVKRWREAAQQRYFAALGKR